MPSELRFRASAFSAILEEVRRVPPETGGLLVGDPQTATVTKFIPAGAESVRRGASFNRASKDLQARLDAAVEAGEGVYLGELHSHPDAYDTPSSTDSRTMSRICRDPDYAAPTVWLGIAVRRATIDGPDGIGLRTFRFSRGERGGEVAWGIAPEAPAPAVVAATSSIMPVPQPTAPARPGSPGLWQRLGQGLAWLNRPVWRPRPTFWSTLALRQSAILSVHHLRGKRVLLLGCGSIGSQLASHLVRSGVGALTLIDADRVTGVNLGRTVYGSRDVGRRKVDALRAHLSAVNPAVAVTRVPRMTSDLSDRELRVLLATHDLLVDATGVPSAKFRVNALARDLVAAVYPAAYARAAAGEVIFTLPNRRTPCLECVLGSVRRGQSSTLAGQADYSARDGLKAEPALGVDIAHVALGAAKVALALLAAGTGSETERFVSPAANILFVGNQAGWIFEAPFETRWAACGRSPRCSCSRAGGSVIELETGDEAGAAS